MQLTIQEVMVAFIASFSLGAALTPIFRKIAVSLGIVDSPNQKHKTHVEPIPYLGGISIVTTVLVGLSVTYFLNIDFLPKLAELLVLIAAPILLATVGLIDDLRSLGALSRLVVQSIAALFVALIFMEFGWFGQPTSSQLLNSIVSIFWIVGITNALNFIDNLDGGAGGIVVISSSTLAFAAILCNQFALAALTVLVAGATSGFLVWNLYPARIYLGDAGSLFLGSILAVLAMRLDPATANPFSGWFFVFLLFAMPILDISVVVISRTYKGNSPFQGGRDHVSHRLMNLGLSKRMTVLSVWLMQLYFSALGLLLLGTNSMVSLIVELISTLSWLILFVCFLRIGFVVGNDHKN